MITPGIVAFDPAAFIADFPAFASVSASALNLNFSLATLQLNNSYSSIVQDEPTRAQLLNLLTAHITALLNGVNGQAPTGVVGRISGATQGSVSVQTDFKSDSEAASYFNQTQWGATFWRATAIYRTARYLPPVCWDTYFGDAWPQ